MILLLFKSKNRKVCDFWAAVDFFLNFFFQILLNKANTHPNHNDS